MGHIESLRPSLVVYSDPDLEHEKHIAFELCAMELCYARGERDQAVAHWKEFAKLISQRSSEIVEQMERARNLI